MAPPQEVWPGESYPLGASYDGAGTNFAVFAEPAERVELCLIAADGGERCVPLPECTGYVWHGYLPGIGPGQRYGFRVHGPYDPAQGHRCNPHKLLLDPYAKAIAGSLQWNEAVFGYRFGDPDGPPSTLDSAPFVPHGIVVNPWFDWADDRHPRTPWHETVIYEAHVRGLTRLHPEVPPHLRGSYAAIAWPPVVEYLKRLGVTAIELQPVHHFVHEHALVERGLRNYWGYNSIGFLAPHAEYSASGELGEQVLEFKQMVKVLHAAGIEVILDVVYNHTAEGNHLGPTLSFRGIDNAGYYRLADDRRYCTDFTGCGNSFNMRSPQVLRLLMDSLRYWIEEMHVDGFRFDLAAALARELHAVDRLAAFMNLIQQDPVVSRAKLIAEPWDVGDGGYQVGNFPPQWSEWNGKFRDCVRDFVGGRDQSLAEFASRLTGSSDLYESTGRRPFASVNFVTAHDGFTLRDLVSYNDKHNEANGEDNRDGESHNRSWNCGAEGDTDDAEVLALRARQQRNFLAVLFLSQGVPMLVAGDELGRTQRGNNNGYCQDNETSWIDWHAMDDALVEFTRRIIALRREHPVFRRRRFFHGWSIRGSRLADIGWFKPDGAEMNESDWGTMFAKSIAVFLNGRGIASPDRWGRHVLDDDFYLMFNQHHEPLSFALPAELSGRGRWQVVLDTAQRELANDELVHVDTTIRVEGRGICMLRRAREEAE
ncbi:MAG TPA: glycogen debranching protein GlgX [Nannocystaceae bacterium]|nr:glycogen debranching protein GlgX [Nannocystaceae bacterium]